MNPADPAPGFGAPVALPAPVTAFSLAYPENRRQPLRQYIHARAGAVSATAAAAFLSW